MNQKNLETLFNFELNLLHKNTLRSTFELHIKSLPQKIIRNIIEL